MSAHPAVLVDNGGSGTRFALATGGELDLEPPVQLGDYQHLVRAIRDRCRRPPVVGISMAGIVDSKKGYVRLCRHWPWAEGDLRCRLENDLDCPVVIMNDGEAHGYAMLRTPAVEFGAVSISLGTSVGVGIIDADRHVVRPLTGENWELGHWPLHTQASNRSVWWALGSPGLAELETRRGDRAGKKHFGYRLGAFITQLTGVFQMRSVVLSGGLAQSCWPYMRPALLAELSNLSSDFGRPEIILSPHAEAALVGVAHALGVVLEPAPSTEPRLLATGVSD